MTDLPDAHLLAAGPNHRLKVDKARMLAFFDGKALASTITSRDIQVLFLLSEREGTICRRDEIGLELWGEDYDPGAVHKFISRLKAKLPKELSGSIVSVRGVGYRLEIPAPSPAQKAIDWRFVRLLGAVASIILL